MAGESGDNLTITGILTGVVALPYILYKVWQQVKSDNKGDDLDVRVREFTKQLQDSLDRVVSRADALQSSRDSLASENAEIKARLQLAEAEIKRLQSICGQSAGLK